MIYIEFWIQIQNSTRGTRSTTPQNFVGLIILYGLCDYVMCKITTGICSDHWLVYFNIYVENPHKGPGYFKLNNTIISDNAYQWKIKQSI